MIFSYRFFSDGELVKRWQDGDGRAGDEVVRRYWPEVVRIARFAYHVQEHLAEDVAQETFLRLQRSLHSYVARGPLTGYVRMIAVHVCLDLRREGAFRGTDREDPIDNGLHEVPDPGQDPATALALSSQLRECLERLTQRAREVLLLKTLHGASYRDISRRFGIPEGTVGRIISEARQSLAECMGGDAKKAPALSA